ncbi:MAG: DUF411 domain-containing protein [Gemmatimonadota bacterium]|jgi:hypothetical protein|nr:DUF411 domain-containing protein [Gemmatimonadota bacterium]
MIQSIRGFRALIVAGLVGLTSSGCTDSKAQAESLSGIAPEGAEITVYLTPTCGCCSGWIEHMRAAGFTVNTVYQDNLTETQHRLGVPDDVLSCHVGVIDNYVVEGHVPAEDVARMLRERPQIAGIAVPGMVTGTPGMESMFSHGDPYDVVSFDSNGEVRVYESHR